jgi:hypothetical protein
VAEIFRFIAPCNPVPTKVSPAGDTWLHEPKLDGYRLAGYGSGMSKSWLKIKTRPGVGTISSGGGRSLSRGAEQVPYFGALVSLASIKTRRAALVDVGFDARRHGPPFAHLARNAPLDDNVVGIGKIHGAMGM